MYSIQFSSFLMICCYLPTFILASLDNTRSISKTYCILSNGNETLKFDRRQYRLNISDSHFLYFTICGLLESVGCNGSSACIKVNGAVLHAGKKFQIDGKKEDTQLIHSTGGDKCISHTNQIKRHSLKIELSCRYSSQIQPNFVSYDGCEYNINMMSFDCEPYCTKRIDDYLIDLRPLSEPINITSGDKTFALSICNANSLCGSGVSSCRILPDHDDLSLTKTEEILFDKERNSVMIRGKIGQKGPSLRILRLQIICNWEVTHEDWQFITKQTQGKYYDFLVHSKYGCLKLQSDCIIDNPSTYTRYNLGGLYTKRGWRVNNVTEGEIMLNVCGDLKVTPDTNTCFDYKAQVCEIKDKTYISRGSSVSFEVMNDYVQGTISDGSVCKTNSAKNYDTKIKFLCHTREIGPVLSRANDNNNDSCTLYLEWKTPLACPYYHSSSSTNCHVNDESGLRNFNGLSEDKVYNSSGYNLIYNICGPIKSFCGMYIGNVSACLLDSSGSHVIGWLNEQIVSENQTLILSLEGQQCRDNINSRTIVNFTCSRSGSREDYVENPDKCNYIINVHTHLACFPQITYASQCRTCNSDKCYNLNQLTNSSNYVVRSSALPEIDFFINICVTVVNQYDLKCLHSMACFRNRSEFNVLNRYHSLGSMNKLTLTDDELILESTSGSDCGEGNYYKSIFHFECSEKEEEPELLEHSKCTFEFIWRTKVACGEKKCHLKNQLGNIIDLDTVKTKQFRLNFTDDSHYNFNICNNYYDRYIHDKTERHDLMRRFDENYLMLSTGESCFNNSGITLVKIKLLCENLSNNDHFEYISHDTCIVTINLYANAVCSEISPTSSKESINVKPTEAIHYVKSTETVLYTTPKRPVVPEDIGRPKAFNINIYLNCNISAPGTENVFSLSTFQSLNFTIDNNNYSISWTNYQNDQNSCYDIEFHKPQESVDIFFATNLICYSGYLKIKATLQCEENESLMKLMSKKVEKCLVSLTYVVPEICTLMKNQKVKMSNSDIIGVTIGILILFIGLGCCYCFRNKFRKPTYGKLLVERPVIYSKNAGYESEVKCDIKED